MREKVFEFWEFPLPASYFVPYNFYCASSPESVFTQKRMLNRRTPQGSLALTGDVLTEHRDGQVFTQQVKSREALQEIAASRFGLPLPPEALAPSE